MDDWKEASLQEVASFQEGPGILAKDFSDKGIPLVRLSGLGGYEVTLDGCNFVKPELGNRKWSHFRLKKGDILVSTSASFGRPTVVGNRAEGAIFYTGIFRFRSLSSYLNEKYLKLFLGSSYFMKQAEAMASGSVIRHFGPLHLREMRITLPPFTVQEAIADVVGTLDYKIELNRRTNETLEAMAQAIFKDWFVDFGPTRAKAEGQAPYLAPELWELFPDALDDEDKPVGWCHWTLADLAIHHRATVSPTADPASLFEHYSIPAYDGGQEPAIDVGASIKSNKTTIPPDTVLLSKLNPDIPRVWIPKPPDNHSQVTSTEFLVFTPKPPATRSLLYCLFRDADFRREMEAMVTGTSKSHQRVSPKALVQRQVLYGVADIFEKFDQRASLLLTRILNNRMESHTLAQTRDLLLPKLMSGEIRLCDVEKVVEAVA